MLAALVIPFYAMYTFCKATRCRQVHTEIQLAEIVMWS